MYIRNLVVAYILLYAYKIVLNINKNRQYALKSIRFYIVRRRDRG